MKKLTIIVSLIGLVFGQVDTSYSWENGGTILGSYGNISNPQNVGTTNGIDPYDGAAMLSVSESPLGGTPEAYIAFIENLSENDVVTASYYGYDDTGGSPSLRIWGGWASNGDITDYQGSAGGNSNYTDGSGWSQLSNTWTVPSGKEALVIKARLYSGSDDPTMYFIDSIAVTSPSTSTVTFPTPTVVTLMADAGMDQTVGVNSTVTLDGSGSDGNITAWAWTQLTGVSVTLTNADQASSSFTAPVTEGDMSFELLVTDDGGESDRDTVNISVVDVGASAVFISEYVEGSSNNKYIEIYNGGDTAIDLNADGYTLARDNDGNMDFTYGVLSDWGSLSILNTGAVIVLAADGHEIYTSPDTVLEYPSPVHFNGNDAVALLRSGVVVDIVGELGNTADHIKDTTLTRNANITQGNSTFSWSEWTGSSTNNVSGLGQHNANVSAPAVAISNISPDFIADNVEIEISAQIVPVSGSISSAAIYYGTTNALINTATMSWDADSTWIGYITTGTEFGNELLQYKVIAIDNSGNQGESSVSSTLVASSTPDDIDEIHANVVEGQIVTIQGIITIGSGLLDTSKTKAYIQDDSDRGLNLFDYDLITGIDRGDELRVVGIVDQYFSTVEVTDFEFETVSTGNALPAPLETTSSGANSSDYEGTLISFPGEITVLETIGDDDGLKLTIDDVTTVMIWNSTGVTTSGLEVGTSWGFTGIGSQYIETYQLLVAYDEDIATLGIDAGNTLPNEFALYPAFPNPFNPKTTISFTTDIAGVVHVDIYDINGRKIDELTQEFFSPGSYSVAWNASSLASGIYFIRIRNNTNHAIQKVMLLK